MFLRVCGTWTVWSAKIMKSVAKTASWYLRITGTIEVIFPSYRCSLLRLISINLLLKESPYKVLQAVIYLHMESTGERNPYSSTSMLVVTNLSRYLIVNSLIHFTQTPRKMGSRASMMLHLFSGYFLLQRKNSHKNYRELTFSRADK